MVNINSEVVQRLETLGLTRDHAVVYVALNKKESTHLQLSRQTDVNRTKVYRIIDDLEKQGLVARHCDDTGTFLVAQSISALEDNVHAAEQKVSAQRQALSFVNMFLQDSPEASEFVVRTYKGVAGMKQMQWHELKAKGELLAFGFVAYEELVGSRKWAEEFRFKASQQQYKIRELIARLPSDFTMQFSECDFYLKKYKARQIAGAQLPIFSPFVVYNNTVAIYQIDGQVRFGVEIINAGFAATMRRVFQDYWRLAKPL